MNKLNYLYLFVILVLSSCSLRQPETVDYNCVRVLIPRNTAYVTQKVNYKNDFRIEVVGYSAYCYLDSRVNRRKVVITPQFKVECLRKDFDETDVDFEYYTETIKGPPEYLGRKQYFGHINIQFNKSNIIFSGKTVELKVPNQDYEDFTINLGLELTPEERKYNNSTFDIN